MYIHYVVLEQICAIFLSQFVMHWAFKGTKLTAFIDTACVVCRAGFIKRSSVRLLRLIMRQRCSRAVGLLQSAVQAEILIESGERRRPAANARSVMSTAELRRLNTDL